MEPEKKGQFLGKVAWNIFKDTAGSLSIMYHILFMYIEGNIYVTLERLTY